MSKVYDDIEELANLTDDISDGIFDNDTQVSDPKEDSADRRKKHLKIIRIVRRLTKAQIKSLESSAREWISKQLKTEEEEL